MKIKRLLCFLDSILHIKNYYIHENKKHIDR